MTVQNKLVKYKDNFTKKLINRIFPSIANKFLTPRLWDKSVEEAINFEFPNELQQKEAKKLLEELLSRNHNLLETLNIKMQKLSKFLKLDYTNKTYLAEAVLSQPNDTESRKSIWEKNSKILLEDGTMKNIVQTITTKQDRHPNSGNIYFNPNNNKSNYRFLTPRECFVLMGFDEKDYEKIINNNFNSRKNSLFFSRDKMYKLAGNSIVVNMLEAIFEQAMDLNNILYNEE